MLRAPQEWFSIPCQLPATAQPLGLSWEHAFIVISFWGALQVVKKRLRKGRKKIIGRIASESQRENTALLQWP